MIVKKTLLAVAGLATCLDLRAGELPWQVEDFLKPPATFPAPGFEGPEGVKALFFEGPSYQGKPTRVFAWYGVPANASGKVPGMVLVHGGAGTAYAEWVKLWIDRGYAAIAFDHFGGLPEREDGKWKRNPDGGPNTGGPWQMAWPVKDQWMYHAVADTLLATSLLGSMPGVDADRIGLTGISWGGVLASTVAGLDSRLKFVAPVYGCGFISYPSKDGSQFVGKNDTPELLAKWRETWDPARYLAGAKMPMLWLSGTNDFAFTPGVWQQSYRTAPGPHTLSLHLRMAHGQSEGAAPEEIAAFADAILRDGLPLPRVTGQDRSDDQVWAGYESEKPLKSATLIFTRQEGPWQDRLWESIPATVDTARGRVSATLPGEARAYCFQLVDERGLIVSSDLRPETPLSKDL